MTESSKNSDLLDIRVVVAVDFGTTFSGYGYAHKANPFDIVTNDDWPQNTGQFKTPTVLKYDESFNVSSWGLPALAEKPSKKKKSTKATITELFKLHLAKIEEKPPLPDGLDYKKAITDYLTQLGKSIKETINKRWPNIEFFDQVLLVLTIPAEYDDSAIGILRECAYNAGLLNNKSTKNLIFTTEPETAAIYCMKVLKEHKLEVGASFMVVDCGGGTVDLTTRELLKDEKLSEKTVRMGGFCGGSYVDKEFIKFVGEKVGENVIEIVTQNHYSQLQYMVQDFCRKVKMQFTGNMLEYETYEIDIEELCPVIKQYIMDEEKIEELEDSEWLIELTFEDVKAMFDPVVKKIVELIRKQLDDNKESECSAMFLVGGFSESKYLQSIIKKEFSSRVKNISVPAHPMTAIVRGAVMFGLRKEVVVDRRLKWNYGTDVVRLWKQTDPLDLRLQNGLIKIFNILAKKGKKVNVNESVSVTCAPYSLSQRQMDLDLYKTDNDEAQYCDKSEDVELLGKFVVPRLPKSNDYNENTVLFTLTFGTVEIEAKAVVESTGEKLGDATFELDL